MRAKYAKKKNHNLNLEYLKSEHTEKHIDYLNRLEFNEFIDEEDYIEER